MLEEQRRAVMAGVMSGPSKSGELSFFQKVPEKIKMLEINLSFLQVHSLLRSLPALLVHKYKYWQQSRCWELTSTSSWYTVYYAVYLLYQYTRTNCCRNQSFLPLGTQFTFVTSANVQIY